jgi:hypothetical protein
MESLPASATDGLRIFIPVISAGRSVLAQVDVRTGVVQNFPLPSEIASPTLGDLSPDGSTLLLRTRLSADSEEPLWTVTVGGGSALRVANIAAHDATWMPDGKSILYAAGNQLLINKLQDGLRRGHSQDDAHSARGLHPQDYECWLGIYAGPWLRGLFEN